jgi:glycosyltransferase involved in cell wall biosynthesis
MRIHQLSPGISQGDATSNHIFEIDARLKAWGFESYIYADRCQPELQSKVRPFPALRPFLQNPDDLLIYHYGIFHASALFFQSAKCKRILIYHNITPAHFFHGWDANNEHNCHIGRLALHRLLGADVAVGVSEFNRQELIAVGFDEAKTAVLPIFLTPEAQATIPIDKNLQSKIHQSANTNWLTVGRVVPNKGIPDLIRLFYVYNKSINPHAHLYIVGSNKMQAYHTALKSLAQSLEIEEHITFTGRVSDSHLKTYYQSADLYVSASYHEGFCVPLIESMHYGLPILAHAAAAIPETLGHAGVQYTELGYSEVAEMAHLIKTDRNLNQQIIDAQHQRLAHFSVTRLETQLKEILARVGYVPA